MGTHPIFESDFDCLTDCRDWKMNQRRWNEANGFTVAEIKAKLAEWREVFPVNKRSPGKNNKAARSAVVDELLPEIPMREVGGGRRLILRLDMAAEIGVICQEQDTWKLDTSKLNTTRNRMTADGSILKENIPMVPVVSAGREVVAISEHDLFRNGRLFRDGLWVFRDDRSVPRWQIWTRFGPSK